jgi:hypothetical protein
VSEKKITETQGRREEWTDVLGDKHTKDETVTIVNGVKTESGKTGGK